jgi:FkbM family methyltransferase
MSLNHEAVETDLIYDIGIHNGDDTAYYLSRGQRVVAVDANPMMIEAARPRFAEEIRAGRLTLVNAGILDRAGTLPFYVNENHTHLSSFDSRLAGVHGDPCRQMQIECMPLPVLFSAHGLPYYLKVDIEGADKLCAKSLVGSRGLPPYVSFEFSAADGAVILDTLCALGYHGFKLIYAVSFTQSEPIFRDEVGMRLLRKLRRRVPLFGSLVAGLPEGMRPAKAEFDTFRERLSYPFPMGSSGPFADETHGPWRSADHVRDTAARLSRAAAVDPEANLWYDIHARR